MLINITSCTLQCSCAVVLVSNDFTPASEGFRTTRKAKPTFDRKRTHPPGTASNGGNRFAFRRTHITSPSQSLQQLKLQPEAITCSLDCNICAHVSLVRERRRWCTLNYVGISSSLRTKREYGIIIHGLGTTSTAASQWQIIHT